MSENGRWLFVESAGDCPEATLASDKFTIVSALWKPCLSSDEPERWSPLSHSCHFECWLSDHATDSPDILKLIKILWPSEVTHIFPASVISENNEVQ